MEKVRSSRRLGTAAMTVVTLRPVHLALVGALAALVLLVPVAVQRWTPRMIHLRPEVATVTSLRPVSIADDAGKPGDLRSVMGQLRFRQAAMTTGPSPDVLRFVFDAPAQVVGVLVSVDIVWLPLVEVAAGIGAENYGTEARDWIIHTSDQNGGEPSKIDETVMLPGDGLAVGTGESVDVVAWLYNDQDRELWVSPEVIVFYRWR